MSFVHLHIPHTGGRSLLRFCWIQSIQIVSVHNPEGIRKLLPGISSETIRYCVLRHPIERAIGEFTHYSRNLKQIGLVNHLKLDEIRMENPNFDLDSPFDYFNLEVNCNPYCKFLLLRTDFSEPITLSDFVELENLIKVNKIKYDLFNTQGTEYQSLYNLLPHNERITLEKLNQSRHLYHIAGCNTQYKDDQRLMEYLESKFIYDLRLFKLLTDRKN